MTTLKSKTGYAVVTFSETTRGVGYRMTARWNGAEGTWQVSSCRYQRGRWAAASKQTLTDEVLAAWLARPSVTIDRQPSCTVLAD